MPGKCKKSDLVCDVYTRCENMSHLTSLAHCHSGTSQFIAFCVHHARAKIQMHNVIDKSV